MKNLWVMLFMSAFLCGCVGSEMETFRHKLGQGLRVAGDNMQRQQATNAAELSAFGDRADAQRERETDRFNNWCQQQQIQLQNQNMIDAVRRSR